MTGAETPSAQHATPPAANAPLSAAAGADYTGDDAWAALDEQRRQRARASSASTDPRAPPVGGDNGGGGTPLPAGASPDGTSARPHSAGVASHARTVSFAPGTPAPDSRPRSAGPPGTASTARLRSDDVAARTRSIDALARPLPSRVAPPAQRFPLTRNDPVPKVLDHPLRPSSPAYPFATARRGVPGAVPTRPPTANELARARIDLRPPRDVYAPRRGEALFHRGWSAFGDQPLSARETAPAPRFPRQPREAAWEAAAKRRASEPAPDRYGSGMMRHRAVAPYAPTVQGLHTARHPPPKVWGTAAARGHPSKPTGTFRYLPGEVQHGHTLQPAERADARRGAGAQLLPYQLLRPRRRVHAAPPAPRGFGGSAKRTCALGPAPNAGSLRGGESAPFYYTPVTR